jgi:DNA-directed RNA polymerase specialized sigma24 family protein
MGMTVPEISQRLSAPEGTVKSYMHRARAKLHRLLATKGISDV